MSNLRDLFHRPEIRTINGVDFIVYKLAFERFDDALIFGRWLQQFERLEDISIEQLEALKAGMPEHGAMLRLVASCLCLPGKEEGQKPQQLTQDDVSAMPVLMLALVVSELMEVNLDFFIQTLPKFEQMAGAIKLTGSALLSASSALGTTETA